MTIQVCVNAKVKLFKLKNIIREEIKLFEQLSSGCDGFTQEWLETTNLAPYGIPDLDSFCIGCNSDYADNPGTIIGDYLEWVNSGFAPPLDTFPGITPQQQWLNMAAAGGWGDSYGNIPGPENPCSCCPQQPIPGCTDPEAINYNLNADYDDGSCENLYDCPQEDLEGLYSYHVTGNCIPFSESLCQTFSQEGYIHSIGINAGIGPISFNDIIVINPATDEIYTTNSPAQVIGQQYLADTGLIAIPPSYAFDSIEACCAGIYQACNTNDTCEQIFNTGNCVDLGYLFGIPSGTSLGAPQPTPEPTQSGQGQLGQKPTKPSKVPIKDPVKDRMKKLAGLKK